MLRDRFAQKRAILLNVVEGPYGAEVTFHRANKGGIFSHNEFYFISCLGQWNNEVSLASEHFLKSMRQIFIFHY